MVLFQEKGRLNPEESHLVYLFYPLDLPGVQCVSFYFSFLSCYAHQLLHGTAPEP